MNEFAYCPDCRDEEYLTITDCCGERVFSCKTRKHYGHDKEVMFVGCEEGHGCAA
jgi:hypothetical protein